MDYNARHQALIIAGPEAVADAVDIVRAFAAETPVAEGVAQRAAIIVEEVIANIMEHGAPPVDSAIGLILEAAGQGLRVEISDAARPFDLRDARRADAVPERGGGAGIALIRAWSTIESYARRDGRNTLVLLVGATR